MPIPEFQPMAQPPAQLASQWVSQTNAQAAYRQAAQYSEANNGLAIAIAERGQLVFEAYAPGVDPQQPQPLASGTKSFSCAIAVAAVADKLLSLDEPVAQTITEWQAEPQKSQITIRQLLNLTSGLPGGTLGKVPSYQQAIAMPLKFAPGDRFMYGPVPFQVFGEVMHRKLMARRLFQGDPLAYLTARVFQPIGLQVGSWRRDDNNQPHLPSGARLTAREWIKFGTLMLNQGKWQGKTLLQPALLRQCWQGSTINPAYGLTFWLNGTGSVDIASPFGTFSQSFQGAPQDLIMALGAGNQGLYIIPSRGLVVVRQGELSRRTIGRAGQAFRQDQFLKLLLQ
jgi:CubicO group peptidase (beta-lactamase class C family)